MTSRNILLVTEIIGKIDGRDLVYEIDKQCMIVNRRHLNVAKLSTPTRILQKVEVVVLTKRR